jgi:ribosomal protein L37E
MREFTQEERKAAARRVLDAGTSQAPKLRETTQELIAEAWAGGEVTYCVSNQYAMYLVLMLAAATEPKTTSIRTATGASRKVFSEIYNKHFPQSERPLTDKASLPATFTCPKCGAVSYNPNDVKERYCGACHEFFKAEGVR